MIPVRFSDFVSNGCGPIQMDATPAGAAGLARLNSDHVSLTGLCLHSDLAAENSTKFLTGYLKSITGWDRSWEDLLKTGERIANMRHAFTIREGDNPLARRVHGRIIGRPPFEEGPLAGVSVDIEGQILSNLEALDWDTTTCKPSKKKLLELGLNDVARDFWPEK
jgi:aldehyde:ferredoxin oxidoreductase